jgi:hypothetical protein
VNIIYLLLLPELDWEFGKTKEAHNFKNKKLEVLVFGNSTSMDGINSEILQNQFGPTYNFSVGGASLQTNYIQLEEYLKQNDLPKKVLLFISSSHINYDNATGINPIINYYYGDSSHIFHLNCLERIPLFEFRWLFVENIKKLLSSTHRSARVVKGQLRINSTVPDNSLQNNISDSCYRTNYHSTGYDYMWQILKLCQKKNIELKVFEMPCWKSFQNNCRDLSVNKVNGNSNSILTIHNLNNSQLCDSLLDPKNDWLSKNHLNYNGSLKITAKVVEMLSQKNKPLL